MRTSARSAASRCSSSDRASVLNIARRGAIMPRGSGAGSAVAVRNRKARFLRSLVLATAAVLIPAAALRAALPTEPPDVSEPPSPAGRLLIASPDMRDPFDHAVILLAQHSSHDGALGVVINHPLDSRPIATVLKALGADTSGVKNDVRLFLGGPVSPNVAFVVHSVEYRRNDTIDIDGRVALSEAPDVLRDMGLGRGPSKSLVTLGYTGWAPSQLEDESGRGAWVTVAEDPQLVFDDDRAKVWADALALYKTDR
jgi:putative transcriptional regulator